MKFFMKNYMTRIYLYSIIMMFNMGAASQMIPLQPYRVVFEYKGEFEIAIKARKNDLNRLSEVVLIFEKRLLSVPIKHLDDLANPDLATIEYNEYRGDDGELVSLIRMNYDQRIYRWGSASSKVAFRFKKHTYMGREIITPTGAESIISRFEEYKN